MLPGARPGPHYPQRHLGTFNVLYCDAHVANLLDTDLYDRLFYAQGH
jgi:prepilin-type processing-associated H-X9-DG protein